MSKKTKKADDELPDTISLRITDDDRDDFIELFRRKQNENSYGQLFIDGPMLSLVRPRQANRRRPRAAEQPQAAPSGCEKKSTPLRDLVNTPTEKKSTLRNLNPKTEIQEEERLLLRLKDGSLARHRDPELQRIAQRAAQTVENITTQGA